MPKRKAQARWEGTLQDGNGRMSFGSGAFEGPYSFQSRFEEGDGTNPEELIGAAHAGCFSMALSKVVADAGGDPESIETQATVHLDKADGGFTITRIELDTRGRVPGMDEDGFRQAAETAKETCPVSQLLKGGADISVTASLEG